MSRAEVRETMQSLDRTLEEFQKGFEGPVLDGFHGPSFAVFYDADERVEYIELSGNDEFEARLGDLAVLDIPAEAVVERVSSLAPYDDDDPELGYSYVFPALDLAFWRPVMPEDENDDDGRTFAAVGVGAAGYFSRTG